MINTRQIKRGIYERFRKKRWLWFKNRGLETLYFNRFKEMEVSNNSTWQPKEDEFVGAVNKLVWWRRIIYYIQKFIYNLFKK